MINKCIKKLSITFLFLISFFIIFGCFACNQFYSEKQKGYISISLNEETPLLKTILPEENPYQNMLGLSWTLSCKKVDSGTDSEIFTRTWSDKTNDSLESDAGEIGSVISAYSQMITDSFSIDLGNYNFELVAKLENEAVLTASKTEEIVAGSQTLVFKMEEASGENVAKGKIDFTLNFPENIVHNVEAALYKWESSNFVENGSYLFSKNSENPQTLNTFNYVQDSIDSGFYLLKILFKQDIGINTTSYKTIYTYTSLVRIAPGLTSSKTVTLNTLPKLYQISYVDDDGTTELCPTGFYNQFTSFNLPTPEEKENMTFLGWFLYNGQNTPVELDDNGKFHISEDTTLYAGWESSVVYEDGNGITIQNEIIEYTALVTVLTNETTVTKKEDTGAFTTGNVKLSPYAIGKYEVTQKLYESVMKTNPSGGTVGDNYPVNMVTWYDAINFCNELTKVTMGEDCCVYTITNTETEDGHIISATVEIDATKKGYRLPTEAEWEFAARGGNPDDTTNWNYEYAGSDNASEVAWYFEENTIEVGQLNHNFLGLYDMSGNIAEWTNTEAVDFDGTITKMARGGHYESEDNEITVYYNDNTLTRNATFDSTGLRLCRTITE